MRVHVKFFAILREMTGIGNEWTEVPEGTTIESLWKQYASRSPRVGSIRAAFAVNQRLVKSNQVLNDGDEVGFLPPVSGGAVTRKRTAKRSAARKRTSPLGDATVTKERLDLGALMKRVAFPGAGAIVTFSGVVRDNSGGKSVEHLEYEAYPEMAESTLQLIISEIKERWPDVRTAIAHRVGKLKIGEASLLIVNAAPHRAEAYAASRYAIERIKVILPVWKKEFAVDGNHWVEGPVAGEVAAEKAEAIVRDADYTPF